MDFEASENIVNVCKNVFLKADLQCPLILLILQFRDH